VGEHVMKHVEPLHVLPVQSDSEVIGLALTRRLLTECTTTPMRIRECTTAG
jgi:hypothetical protein